jgi:hypothetical protein
MAFNPSKIRSRTAVGRLRGQDLFLAELLSQELSPDDFVVDLGFGEEAWTVLEMAAQLRKIEPNLRVIGLETDPRRISGADPDQNPLNCFEYVEPEDELSLQFEGAAMLRAMNVLRSYPEHEIWPTIQNWAKCLRYGGWLLEGSSSASGHILTSHVWRRMSGQVRHLGLLLYTDFSSGFAPWMFRDHLPRDLRRNLKPEVALYQTLAQWHENWLSLRTKALTQEELFSESSSFLNSSDLVGTLFVPSERVWDTKKVELNLG